MSQLSRRESTLPNKPSLSDPKSVGQSLDPVLKAVLDSLDVDLDTELSRYRRHILLQQRAARQAPAQASALTATSPFSFEGLDDTLPPAMLPASIDDLTAEIAGTESLAASTPSLVANDTVDSVISSDIPPDSDDDVLPAAAVTASALATIADEDQGQLSNVAEENLSTTLPSNPDDYLASSEELLRSLEDEEKRAEAIAAEEISSAPKSSLVDSIFTPLGVGSILLLILSSATLGYLVIRPSTLNMLASWTNWKSASVPGLQSQPEGGLSNLSPDLAAGEFDPLKASNLSSLPGVVQPSAIGGKETLGTNATDETGTATSDPTSNDNSVVVTSGPTSAINSSINSRGTGGSTPTPPVQVVGSSLATSLPTAPPRLAPPRPVAVPTPRSNPPAPRQVATPRNNAPAPRPTVSAPVTAQPFAPRAITPVPSPPAPTRNSSPAPSRSPAPTPSRNTPIPDPIGPEPIVTPIEEQIGPAPARPTPQASPAPAQIPIQAPPRATSAPAPTPAPEPTPAPAPAPAPVSTTPAPSASVNDDLYYVTTPYTGDSSLESAQDAVSGSHVRNFPQGTQVQMGAFSNEAGAEEMVENLQNQGISAEVYTGE